MMDFVIAFLGLTLFVGVLAGIATWLGCSLVEWLES